MKLNNKVYDFLKWVLMVAVAPTIAFITGLGELYNFETSLIVGTISLVATFLGALMGISNYNYNRSITLEELSNNRGEDDVEQ